MRGEFFLTLDITPRFILQDMVGAVQIGKAAKVAGVSVDTIRFYQKLAARADIACSTESRFVISRLSAMLRSWGSL
jgi:hypothetical protein